MPQFRPASYRTGDPLAAAVVEDGGSIPENAAAYVTGPATVTLPAAAEDATEAHVVDAGGDAEANPITIEPAPGDTIDGEASIELAQDDGTMAFVYFADESDWKRVLVPRSRGTPRETLPYFVTRDIPLLPPPELLTLNYDQIDTDGGGAPIAATGSNFLLGATAIVDGVAAATTVVDDTNLTFVAPAHAAAAGVEVVIRGPGGDSLPLTVEYWSPLDTDGAGTILPGLTGLWRADGATGYTYTDGGVGARSGTFVDAITPNNASSATVAFPLGAAAGGHVPPQGTRTTGWQAQLNTAVAQSNFIAAAQFSMWSFAETPSEGINSWPDGGGTWTGCYLISCATALSAHLGLTGTNFQPDPPGSARVVIYNGGLNNCQVDGLALDTPYFVLGTWDGATARIRAGGLTNTLAVGGTITDRTTPLRLGSNANNTVSQRGPQYECATMNTVLSDADRAKVLKYGQQRYGRAFT